MTHLHREDDSLEGELNEDFSDDFDDDFDEDFEEETDEEIAEVFADHDGDFLAPNVERYNGEFDAPS